jgi:cell wall-associated NlpC family hydrolase
MGRSPIDVNSGPGQGGDMLYKLGPDGATGPLEDAAELDKRIPQVQSPALAAAAGGGGKVAALIDKAKSQIGVPYVYGARQWGKALDCSGFTQQAFAQIGISIGGDTYTQVTQGTAVDGGLANAQPGDLIFTVGDVGMRVNGHVGIYLGEGKVIAAPHTGSTVQIQDWSGRGITAIRRFF